MEIIYVLLPLSVLLGLGGLIAYLWALKSGQYKDLDTPAMRVLLEEERSKAAPPDETPSAADDSEESPKS
jgi:cbb3-type cytochrome oxidase maturation protein